MRKTNMTQFYLEFMLITSAVQIQQIKTLYSQFLTF